MQITLDGKRSTHNSVKKAINGESAFDTALNHIETALSASENLVIMLRINYANGTLCDELLSQICEHISTPNRKRTQIILRKVWQVSRNNDRKSIVREFMQKAIGNGFSVSANNFVGAIPCYADKMYYACINYNGEAVRCTASNELYQNLSYGITLQHMVRQILKMTIAFRVSICHCAQVAATTIGMNRMQNLFVNKKIATSLLKNLLKTISNMIRQRIFSLITAIVSCVSAVAQTTLSGNIVNTNNKPIPFANVVLYNVGDTVPTAGCIAEFDGAYKISAKANSYCIRISYVGYKTITDTIALDIDAIRNFTLEEQTTDLTEVSVRAQSVAMSTEKNTYFISPNEAKNQQNALSLLNIVPKISVDMVSNAVTGVGGKSVKLLLNGVDVNSVELRAISPNKIAKIERYDIPPARYADYEIVLNVVTKEIEDGFMASVDLSSALTTGFSDPQVTMQYNWRKKNRLTVDYYLGYRNYKHQVSDYSYAYVIDDVRYQEKGHLDKAFGYEQHIPNISYVRQDSVNMLQIKLSPKYTHVHSDADSTRQIMKYHTNANVLSLAGPYNWQNREFNPILDIYYSRLINDKNELAIDITATHFSTINSVDDELIDSLGNAFLCNHANEKNKKTSFIGEVYYSHIFNAFILKSGYILNTNEQKSDANNVLGEWNNVTTSFTSNYIYSELSGKLKKMGYNKILICHFRLVHFFKRNSIIS